MSFNLAECVGICPCGYVPQQGWGYKAEATKLQALNLRLYEVSVLRCAAPFQLEYSAFFAREGTINVIDEVNLRTGEIKSTEQDFDFGCLDHFVQHGKVIYWQRDDGITMTLLKNDGNRCFTRIAEQGMRIQSRSFEATFSFYGKFIFVSGGYSKEWSICLASVKRYNITDDLWETMPAMK